MTDTLVLAVHGLRACDALLAFEWVDDETAVVRATDVAGLTGAVITLRQADVVTGSDHIVATSQLHRFVSSATMSMLPWRPAAAAALRIPATADTPAFGLVLLWHVAASAPSSLGAVAPALTELVSVMLAERRRRESTDLLAHVMRTMPDAVAFLSLDAHGSTINAQAAALLNLPEGRVDGALLAQQLRTLGSRVLNRDAEADVAQHLTDKGESRIRDALWELDGPSPQLLRVSMVDASAGQYRGWLWRFRDVTREELALAAARVHEQERERDHGFLESMLDAMDDNVLACDANGTLFLSNAAARRRYGIEERDILGGNMDTFVASLRAPDGSALDSENMPLLRALRGEHVDDVSIRVLTRHERLLDMNISARPVHGADGTLLGAVAIARDVTQRRRAEQAAQAADRLQSLERMAVGVTHDLNNLMMVVSAASESLAAEVGASPDARRELTLIDAAIVQARAMSGRLLDFCRGRPRARTEVSLRDVVRGTAFLVGGALAPKVRVTVDVPKDGEWVANGTTVEIEQVLLNLLQNAADALPDGGDITVTVSATHIAMPTPAAYGCMPRGDYVTLSVQDTGIGMSAETLRHIFEPFFTTRGDAGGTGLGLATVLGTVHDLGGYVTVTSAPRNGSDFRVYLPLVAAPAGHMPAPVASREGSTGRLPQRLLLVDDDASVRRAIGRMLSRLGVTVIEVSDAKEALATLATPDVDVEAILSDVRMPGMTGIELFERARAQGFGGPMLLMTGYADLDLPDHFHRDGLGKVLTKPFSAAELQESFVTCT